MNLLVGLTNVNPAALAEAEILELSRSAVAFSRVISSGLKNVPALQSVPLNSRGYPTTTTCADAARLRIEEYSVFSRPGSVLLMMVWAPATALVQSPSHDGFAHSVMTDEKPASLPPTCTETMLVELVTDGNW